MPRAGRGDGCLKFEPSLLRCSIGQFEQSGFPHPEQTRRIAAQDCGLLPRALPGWRREGNLSCKDYGRLK
jgi:hypothetical protein